MTDEQELKERPSKRSLTPNRPLYASFNEAHRHIAPPTPKLPLEETLSGDNPLTPEEIEDILSDTSQSKELKETAKCEQSHTPAAGNQIGHESLSTSPFSPSAIEPRSKATDNALHASVSPCDSEDEDAFIGTSVSSVHEFQDHASQQDLTDGPFSNQHAITDGPDASSFYPDEGADYSLASTDDVVDDEFAFNSIKGHPNPSPVLTSSPVLSPPVASGSGNPHQQLPSSHIDDVIKKQAASNYDEVTHLSGQNGSQYPIFIDSGALPPPSIAASQPLFGTEQAIGTGSHNDGDISEISEDHFIGQDKGKTPASCLNPFHAFSATSSHPSDTNAIQPEPDNKKMFLRPQAEREVSRALHHATGLSQPSSGLIVGRTRITRIHDPNQSPYSAHTDQRQDNFYHAPAIQPDWQVTQSGIKIPVPTSPSEDEIYMEAMEPYNTLNNTRMATVASGDAEDRTGLDGDEDWRTVTDDREFPAGAVGRVMTGSSIANVSDVLLARQQRPAGRMPSTTRAWWERNANPLPHTPPLPSPPPPVFGRKQRQQEDWEEIELDPMPAPYKDFSWGRVRSERARAEEEEQHIGGRQYANLPFPLVTREDAARLQAVRRASGLEDQTLSGRVLSPGLPPSTHGASYVLPRPAVRKDSARSLFSRIKNPNFDCRNLFIPEHQQNPFRQPENEYYSTPSSSRPRIPQTRDRASTTTTARKMETISHQAAAEALAIDQSAGRANSPHLYSAEVMARYRAFQAVRQIGGRGTDSELADMAATVRDPPLSEVAASRQAVFYYVIMLTTLFIPIVGVAILLCTADKILSSFTHGECSGLSFNQRRNLRIMVLAGFGV